MRKARKKELPKDKRDIIYNYTIDHNMASVLTGIDADKIYHFRYQDLFKEKQREASQRYRDKQREKDIEKFGAPHSCYNFWSEEEIKYILTSKDSDRVMAEKLNRTIASIQKKRAREVEKIKNGVRKNPR